jgi:NAD(P)-dependent dehydrogenase (short-subunit alcohol dehydrogenase family)
MPKQLLDFTGKVVLITGGRSGIGQATAVAFAEQGAKVVVNGRRYAEETMERIKAVGGEAIFVKGDVSVSADVQNLIDTTVKTFGRLDVAYNNAGLLPVTADLVEQTEEDFDKIMAVDCKGVFLCMKYEIAQMLKQYTKHNIRINAIAPGFTGTEMTSGWMADPAMCELVKSFNFANRIASPEEIAGIVLFLASPMASFISGAVYPVDAAQTAH